MVRRDDLDSLFNEFSIDVDNEAVFREKQARSEALDRVTEFCNLDRQDPQIQKEVMGMTFQAYNALAKKSIEISLPWHSSIIPIADMNHDIVRNKLIKSLKPQKPAKPWSPKDFFGGSGYYTHNSQGYLTKPESLVVPSRPPPAERTAEDQPFFHIPRNSEESRTRVDISSGSASLTASQLIDQEAMSHKNAAAASTALSLAEYIDNYPDMPVGARARDYAKGVQTSFYESRPCTWHHLGDQISPGLRRNFRHAGTNHPHAPKEQRCLLCETPWEIRSFQGREEILGMREQISLMLQKNAITKVPPNSPGFYSNVSWYEKLQEGGVQ